MLLIYLSEREWLNSEEVEAIKEAAEITNQAIESMLMEMKPGNNEMIWLLNFCMKRIAWEMG